nr:unnamed protein product [Callosobruchus analis]
MSNVCPTIPHRLLKDKLEQIGLHLISPISFLRIGATTPEYSHILSFRRQVYFTPTSQDTLPETLEITYEDVTYRIFLSVNSHRCFKCKLTGHNASQCPSTQANQSSSTNTGTQRNADNNETSPAPVQQQPISTNSSSDQDTPAKTTTNTNLTPEETSNSHPTNKSLLSVAITPTSDSEPILENADIQSFTVPKPRTTKKPKTNTASTSHFSRCFFTSQNIHRITYTSPSTKLRPNEKPTGKYAWRKGHNERSHIRYKRTD